MLLVPLLSVAHECKRKFLQFLSCHKQLLTAILQCPFEPVQEKKLRIRYPMETCKTLTLYIQSMGKTYVVFVGREPGIYETWVEASDHVIRFKGAIYKSFKSREEAEKAFEAYLDKKSAPTSFAPSRNEISCATSSSRSSSNLERKLSKAEKIIKLKDALKELERQLDSLMISDDNDDD
ncbi:uncharacterized protein LOC122030369 [Zingiber officinale]|uniref:uncharacterized protein LOC122030369 n=1 Tax=Zingiber officinale TaxID=94328 RepID=UPI001C4B84CD|nr:uncharacterized protein LOC122030369 [Zingiber officinale]